MQQRLIDILIQSGEGGFYNSYELSQKLETSHEEIVSALKSLESRCYVKLTQQQTSKFVLTKEGEIYKLNGSPEHIVYSHIMKQESQKIKKIDIEKQFPEIIKVAQSNGMKVLFEIKGEELCAIEPETLKTDSTRELLETLSKSDYFDTNVEQLKNDTQIQKLKKRKLIDIKQLVFYEVRKDEGMRDIFYEQKADLSYQDIQTGTYENSELFKAMNLNSKGKQINCGGLHPLMKMRTEFRNILLEMGFTEMNTQQYVESSFFNFDSLFQPQ